MAFQMIDDLDDMLDSPRRSYDCDLRNGYISLPVIRLFAAMENGHREALVDIIERADFTPENERLIVSLCSQYGTIDQTQVEIHRHLDRARETLDRFEPGEAWKLLAHVVDDLKAYADTQGGALRELPA